jgi:hypothetical protein
MTPMTPTLDGAVLTRALTYAIAMLDSIPEERRPMQDRNAMVHLLPPHGHCYSACNIDPVRGVIGFQS